VRKQKVTWCLIGLNTPEVTVMEEACPTPRCVFGGFKLKSEFNHASAQHKSHKINYIVRDTKYVLALLVSYVVTQMAVAPAVINTILCHPQLAISRTFRYTGCLALLMALVTIIYGIQFYFRFYNLYTR
jgi:hypothetical protein